MTTYDISARAREVTAYYADCQIEKVPLHIIVANFGREVAEEAAKVADIIIAEGFSEDEWQVGRKDAAIDIAEAIRERFALDK